MKNYLFIRGLRRADHTVFAVADSQKTYYEPQFGRELPYSSGQQVKRSILDALVRQMGVSRAPVQFQYKLDKKDLKKASPVEDIALQQLDPRNVDELLGGWMKATGKGTKKEDDEYLGVIKRRSPLSISAMHPLHPLLANTEREKAISFDRTDDGNSSVRLLDHEGNLMTKEEMLSYLDNNDLTLRKAKYVDSRKANRAYGLFIYDVAIDLERLFAVSIDETQPEIDPKRQDELRSEGWVEGTNTYGPCLIAPKEVREKVLPALAEALVEWHIASNQARTYSPMETLAVSISDKANQVNASIRAKLETNENGRPVATPVLDDRVGQLYTYLPAESYINGVNPTPTALEDAKASILEKLKAYDYESM